MRSRKVSRPQIAALKNTLRPSPSSRLEKPITNSSAMATSLMPSSFSDDGNGASIVSLYCSSSSSAKYGGSPTMSS